MRYAFILISFWMGLTPVMATSSELPIFRSEDLAIAKVCINGDFVRGINCQRYPDFLVSNRCQRECPGTHYLRLVCLKDISASAFWGNLRSLRLDLLRSYDFDTAGYWLSSESGELVLNCTMRKFLEVPLKIMINGTVVDQDNIALATKGETMRDFRSRVLQSLSTRPKVAQYQEKHGVSDLQALLMSVQIDVKQAFVFDDEEVVETILDRYSKVVFLLNCALFPDGCSIQFEDDIGDDDTNGAPENKSNNLEEDSAKAAYNAIELFRVFLPRL